MACTAYAWMYKNLCSFLVQKNNKLKLNGDRNTTIARTYNIMWYDDAIS